MLLPHKEFSMELIDLSTDCGTGYMYADFIINGHFFFGSIDQLSKQSPVIISQTKVVQGKLRQVRFFEMVWIQSKGPWWLQKMLHIKSVRIVIRKSHSRARTGTRWNWKRS